MDGSSGRHLVDGEDALLSEAPAKDADGEDVSPAEEAGGAPGGAGPEGGWYSAT